MPANARQGAAGSCDALQPYREQLDRINELLVDLLAERMQVCRVIARVKSADGMPMMQPQRVTSTLDQVRALSGPRQLRAEYLDELFQLIIEETCNEELRVMASLQPPPAKE
ncbi:chorismate mutase [Pseudomonas sp. 148P]|uniref:chorismate mutase n=1 Tax=Pseudomonas ulcerans TaxID=3115852 RepID=A0ABU7HM46_9PSED|nr:MULTISPECIES: chorismate mutase [unclassified Pseudomonas]MEE1921052.1 chorismate mutase [Pseudomonas sp. 147P]MEE1932599.1 chorismate mutase [Pseudomonas sp. 148P]